MLQLMLLRLVAPRAFQLVNFLGLTFFFLSVLAIASGMVDHDRHQETHHNERAVGTR